MSSVLGPAADIIKNFSITADNYHVAYNELIRHYENKSFTIQSHIQSLLSSHKVVTGSAEEFHKLHQHVAPACCSSRSSSEGSWPTRAVLRRLVGHAYLWSTRI